MAKTDYTKVEAALEEGLRKMTIARWGELADIAAGIGQRTSKEKEQAKERRLMINRIKLDLMRLHKKDKKIYHKLNLDKEEITRKLNHPESLNKEDWKELEDLYLKTRSMVRDLFPQYSDEELIEREQERHTTKRFNVNEKWLPL